MEPPGYIDKEMRGFLRGIDTSVGEPPAPQAIALMHQGKVVDLDATLALAAARLSALERLPLAVSVMLATARYCGATLWTQDADLEGREGVRHVASWPR